MKDKLKQSQLNEQYKYRADLLADLIGRHFGSGNKKRAQMVLSEPNRLALWAVSTMPDIKPQRARMIARNPIHWVFLIVALLIIRSWHKRKLTLKKADEQCRVGMKKYLEQRGQWVFDKLVDIKGVLKFDSRIAKDPEYGKPDPVTGDLVNLTARTQATICSTLMGTPLDPEYPRFTERTIRQSRWQKWLGLKHNDSASRVLLKAFITGVRADNSVLRDINTYFTATGIAREQGYNKGRLGHKSINQLVDTSLIRKGFTYTDNDGNTITEVVDNDAESFVDDTHRKMLLQQVFDIVTDPKDKATLEIYYACYANDGTTLEKEHTRKLRKYQELGLRTPASVRQRFSRIPQKYPQLKELKPYC